VIDAEQYKQIVILQTRELSVFVGGNDRPRVEALLAVFEAASADDPMFLKVNPILQEHTGSVLAGKPVSPVATLAAMLVAVEIA
jgi:hypothetical protein